MVNITYELEIDDFEPLPKILIERGLRYETIVPTDNQLINLTTTVIDKQIGLNHVKPPSDLLSSRNLARKVLNDYNPHSRLMKKHLTFTRQTVEGLLVGDSWSATCEAFEKEEQNADEYQETVYKSIDDIDPTYWPFLYPKYLEERYQDLIPRKQNVKSDDHSVKINPQTSVTTKRRQDVLLPREEINLDYWKYLFFDLYETFGVYPNIIRVSPEKISALEESLRQNESLLWQAVENLDSVLIQLSLSAIEEADLKDLETVIRVPKRGVIFNLPKQRTKPRLFKKTTDSKSAKPKPDKTVTIAKTPTSADKSKSVSKSTTVTKPLSKRKTVSKPSPTDTKRKAISKPGSSGPESVTTVTFLSHPDKLSFDEEDLLSETLDYSDELSTPESEIEDFKTQRILQGAKRRLSLEDTLQLADQKVREWYNEPSSTSTSLRSIPIMGNSYDASEYESAGERSELSEAAMDRFVDHVKLQEVDPTSYFQMMFHDNEFLDEISEPEWYDGELPTSPFEGGVELDEADQHSLVDLAFSDSDTLVAQEVADSIVEGLANRAVEGVAESEIIDDVIGMVQEAAKNSPDPNFAKKVVQELDKWVSKERESDVVSAESSDEDTLQNTVIELVDQMKDHMEREPWQWGSRPKTPNLSPIAPGHEISSNEDMSRETMSYTDDDSDDLINETMPHGDEFDDLSFSD